MLYKYLWGANNGGASNVEYASEQARISHGECNRAGTRDWKKEETFSCDLNPPFFIRARARARACVCVCVCVCVYLTLLSREYIAAVTSIASLIDIIVALRRRERITGDGYSYGILMKAITGEYMPLISRLRLRTRCKKPRIALGKRRARAKRGREGERERERERERSISIQHGIPRIFRSSLQRDVTYQQQYSFAS